MPPVLGRSRRSPRTRASGRGRRCAPPSTGGRRPAAARSPWPARAPPGRTASRTGARCVVAAPPPVTRVVEEVDPHDDDGLAGAVRPGVQARAIHRPGRGRPGAVALEQVPEGLVVPLVAAAYPDEPSAAVLVDEGRNGHVEVHQLVGGHIQADHGHADGVRAKMLIDRLAQRRRAPSPPPPRAAATASSRKAWKLDTTDQVRSSILRRYAARGRTRRRRAVGRSGRPLTGGDGEGGDG